MGLKVGQEASFAVQLNGARGLIDAKIHTPSGAIEECYITELDSGKTRTRCVTLSSEYKAVTPTTAITNSICKRLCLLFIRSTTRLRSGSTIF